MKLKDHGSREEKKRKNASAPAERRKIRKNAGIPVTAERRPIKIY